MAHQASDGQKHSMAPMLFGLRVVMLAADAAEDLSAIAVDGSFVTVAVRNALLASPIRPRCSLTWS